MMFVASIFICLKACLKLLTFFRAKYVKNHFLFQHKTKLSRFYFKKNKTKQDDTCMWNAFI